MYLLITITCVSAGMDSGGFSAFDRIATVAVDIWMVQVRKGWVTCEMVKYKTWNIKKLPKMAKMLGFVN